MTSSEGTGCFPSWQVTSADVESWRDAATQRGEDINVACGDLQQTVLGAEQADLNVGRQSLQARELTLSGMTAANVGGRVCCMAHSPATPGNTTYIAVAVAPRLGQVAAAAATSASSSQVPPTLQIWALTEPEDGKECAPELKCLLHIDQQQNGAGRVLCWCPRAGGEGENSGSTVARAGLLLNVSAGGSVDIYALPTDAASIKPAAEPQHSVPLIALKPKVCATSRDVFATHRPSAACWSPHFPNDLVVVGTDDGEVVLLRLNGAVDPLSPGFQVVSMAKVYEGPVRCVKCAPPHAFGASSEDDVSSMYVVAGIRGYLAVFDLREPAVPVLDLSHAAPGTTFSDVIWLAGDGYPLLICACLTGFLVRVGLHPTASTNAVCCTLTSKTLGLLSLAFSDRLKLAGYSTGGGVFGLLACISRFVPEHLFGNKMARMVPHAVPLGLDFDETGKATVSIGRKASEAQPVRESTRVVNTTNKRTAGALEVDHDARPLKHPWTCACSMLLVDQATRTALIGGSNGGLLAACFISHVDV